MGVLAIPSGPATAPCAPLMHRSQMYTPGPAISFLTCFWLFPQNEQDRSPHEPGTHSLYPDSSLKSGRSVVRPCPPTTRSDQAILPVTWGNAAFNCVWPLPPPVRSRPLKPGFGRSLLHADCTTLGKPSGCKLPTRPCSGSSCASQRVRGCTPKTTAARTGRCIHVLNGGAPAKRIVVRSVAARHCYRSAGFRRVAAGTSGVRSRAAWPLEHGAGHG
jgi:hypothetical protein